MIGDSLTVQAAPGLHQRLDQRFRVTINAFQGFTIGNQLPAARVLGSERPDIAVINLGTNDAWKALPIEQSVRNYEAMVAEFPAGCLVIVTVIDSTAGLDPKDPYHADLAAQLNQRLREIAAVRGAVIVDWASAVAGHELEYNTSAVDSKVGLAADGIHQNPTGSAVLSDLIVKGVDSCPSVPTPASEGR